MNQDEEKNRARNQERARLEGQLARLDDGKYAATRERAKIAKKLAALSR